MNEHYARVFKEYEKRVFPLELLGRSGYMMFKTKEDLREYYKQLSKVECRAKRVVSAS